MDTVVNYAAQFGFDPDEMPRDMTIALGSLPATPLQMATAYAVFANGGYKVDSYFIDRIEDPTGKVVYQAKPKVVCETCDAAQRFSRRRPTADRWHGRGTEDAEPATAGARRSRS